MSEAHFWENVEEMVEKRKEWEKGVKGELIKIESKQNTVTGFISLPV
jgi:hypothetical protein